MIPQALALFLSLTPVVSEAAIRGAVEPCAQDQETAGRIRTAWKSAQATGHGAVALSDAKGQAVGVIFAREGGKRLGAFFLCGDNANEFSFEEASLADFLAGKARPQHGEYECELKALAPASKNGSKVRLTVQPEEGASAAYTAFSTELSVAASPANRLPF